MDAEKLSSTHTDVVLNAHSLRAPLTIGSSIYLLLLNFDLI